VAAVPLLEARRKSGRAGALTVLSAPAWLLTLALIMTAIGIAAFVFALAYAWH
jgi:hypothetical protein